MNFRWKLLLSYLLLILLLSFSYFLAFNNNVQTYFLTESRENLLSQTRLAKILAEHDAMAMPPQQLAKRIASAIKARVTLIDHSGKVLGDSEMSQSGLAEMENHLQRPEVQDALRNGTGSSERYSATLRISMLYTAITYANGAGGGIIRLALPLEYLANAGASLRSIAGSAMILSILCALGLSLILSKITSRPLREMAAAAALIGKREVFKRIPVSTRDEIGALATVLNDMAERIDTQMQSLATEKTRLDTILRGMGEGVMVATSHGTITLVNPAFRSMFGISGSVEGKRLIEISRNPDLQSAFHDLTLSGKELIREILIQPGTVTLLTHWVPLKDAGSGDGVVAVFHDISDMKYVEDMRRDFVANVSHELRTPVSVIKGYAETLMLDGVLSSEPERAVRFVEIIHNHAERLTTLINDILTLSCLESKAASLDLHAMDLGGTANKSCMLLAAHAVEKNIQVRVELPDNLPRVLADHGRLEQVLVNLVDNAVKYTPAGGTVRVTAEAGEHVVKVSVEDSGIGIPAKDLPRIFERFYRVDEGRSRDQGGTGLGLAIVKHIIQLHGGEMTVSSVPGSGSTFSFTLMIADQEPVGTSPTAPMAVNKHAGNI